MIPGSANSLLLGQTGGEFSIERSLRFNSGDSGYIQKSFASSGNRKTWTLSFWVKLNGSTGHLISAGNDAFQIELRSDGQYLIANGGCFGNTYSTAVFRDYSAWQHFVIEHDATNTYCKIYINGSLQKTITASNADGSFNHNTAHNFNGRSTSLDSFTDFYLAEVNFIDGQALTPTNFGELDDDNVWQPKKYEGDYSNTSYTATSLSQVGWAVSTPTPQTNIWDGNTSTVSNGHNGGSIGTVTFTPALTGVTKVELFTQNYNHYLNGSQITTAESSTGWHTYYDNSGSPITLNSVGNSYSNNTQTVDLMAIRINGSIIDSQNWTPPTGVGVKGTGENSFYLPFTDNSSNAALGTDKSGNNNTWTVNNLLAQSTVEANLNWDSSWNPATPNGGVDKASISGNVATALSLKWSMASSAVGLATNAVTTSAFQSSNASNTWFGLGKKLTGSYDQTLRDSSISYGIYFSWNNGTNTPGSHGTSISGITFGTSNVIKLEVDPANSTLKVYKDGSLQQTVTLSSSFVTEITNGNIYWQSDQYSTGTVTLTNGLVNASSDSLVDTPTNGTASSGGDAGGAIVGNYCTLNPLDRQSTNGTLSNGNLDLKQPTTAWAMFRSTMHVSSGRWYWEVTLGNNQYPLIGIIPTDYNMNTSNNYWMAQVPFAYSFYPFSGHTYANTSSTQYTSADTSASGTTYGVALNLDAGTLTYYKNGVSLGVAFTSVSGSFSPAACLYNASNNDSYNFGQRAFHTAAPAGFKSLNTANLPESTIADGSKYFDTKLYQGNGGTQTLSGLGFSPDMVWFKNRTSAVNHHLLDTVRGANNGANVLYPNLANAEGANSSLTAFTSDGFTVGSNDSVNKNNNAIAAWAWEAGSSNTTIAAGGLDSLLYNQSQTWSSSGSISNSGTSPVYYTDTFNVAPLNIGAGPGSFNNGWRIGGSQTATGTSTVTSLNIPFSQSVKIRFFKIIYDQHITGTQFKVNNVSLLDGTAGYSTVQEIDVTSSITSPITSWEINRNTGSNNLMICGIYVDGKLLADPSVSTPSIASTVRSSPESGFSIVSYTGTGSAAEVAHGLNSPPDFIVCKDRDSSSGWWATYISSQGATKGSYLNAGNQAFANFTFWNNTTPTSSVFSIGANANTNASGNDFIAYCFSNVEGYCKIGQHTNGASNNQAFIYTGFRPAWILGRPITADWWTMYDSKRDPDNPLTQKLWPNESAAEAPQNGFDFLSNGFKCIAPDNNFFASSANATWIYMAFAEHPFKTARAR